MSLSRRHIRLLSPFLLAVLTLALWAFNGPGRDAAAQNAEKPPVYILTMKGAISPAMADYLDSGMIRAQENGAQLMILALDTPGGLLSTTREMVSAIVESPVPVAVWVTPAGAHAASAGTFLTYAAHIAAMDHGTNIGAATPVQMQGIGAPSAPGQAPDSQNKDPSDNNNETALREKSLQDTAAFIRSLAEMRGRNAAWAEKAVTQASSLTASEALEDNVIDLIATSRDDLLSALDGREITLKSGRRVTLSTKDAPVAEFKPDWKTRLLIAIADPNVAFILLSIGVYGIILEFFNPGTLVPGTIGTICLLLALYALNIMSVNMVGVALLIAGIAFMVGEAFMPSFGILGLGGLAAFITGATIMFDTETMPGLGIESDIIWGMALLGLIVVGITVFVTVRVYRQRISTGTESMIGAQAEIVSWTGQSGSVRIQGEIWQAFSDQTLDLNQGDKVRVAALDNLKLKIDAAI